MTAKVRQLEKSEASITAVLDAGLALFSTQGYGATTLRQIAERAGLSVGNIYHHFPDKHAFAAAVAAEVRAEVEAEVARANAGVTDPVARIAGGMQVAARFALEQPRRATVLLRSQVPATRQTHPLNRGLKDDIEAALARGLLRPEARHVGLAYWLGLCQVLMTNLIETRPAPEDAAERLAEMLVLGLTGLGVPQERAAQTARNPDSA